VGDGLCCAAKYDGDNRYLPLFVACDGVVAPVMHAVFRACWFDCLN
jgi:hypothetical protein